MLDIVTQSSGDYKKTLTKATVKQFLKHKWVIWPSENNIFLLEYNRSQQFQWLVLSIAVGNARDMFITFFSFKNSASNVLDTNQFSCFPSSIWFIHDLYYQPEKLYHFSGFFLISFKDGFLHRIWTLFLFVWLTWWCWNVAISVVSQLMIPFSSKILHFSPYLLLGIACF